MEKSETLKLVELFLTPDQLEIIALFSLMESEIKDLKNKIDWQTTEINEQLELIKKQNKLNYELVKEQIELKNKIADLEESLIAKSIDGAKPI
jgi:predicted Holliday junction resolvase-like endonuclease